MTEHVQEPPRPYGWIVGAVAACVITAALVVVTLRFPRPIPDALQNKDVLQNKPSSASASAAALVAQVPAEAPHVGSPVSGSAPQAPLLPLNVEAARADIPWTQVGSGWTLAIYASKTKTSGDQVFPVGDQVLYLVNSVGGRYRIATLPSLGTAQGDEQKVGPAKARWYLVAWSPDSRRAIIGKESFVTNGPRYAASEWDLTKGVPLASLGSLAPVGPAYSSDGKSVLNASGAPLARIGLDGRQQQVFPANVADVGVLSSRILPLQDGSGVIVGAQRGMVLLSSAGQVQRVFSAPHGYGMCDPIRWWRSDVVVMSCYSSAVGSGSDVWAVPLLGAPSMLTSAEPDSLGYASAWQTAHGTLLMTEPVCGARGQLHSIDEEGLGVALKIALPAGSVGMAGIVSVQRDQVTLLTSSCASVNGSLLVYSMISGETAVLLGPGLNAGTVLSALGNPADQ
jgi:hypothetical protein